MAKSTRTGASYLAESRNSKPKKNPFTGMTLAEMKKKYSAMTPAQRAANVETFRAAAKTARKPVAKGGSKPRQTTRKEAEARFYSSSSQGAIAKNQEKAKANFFRGSLGGKTEVKSSGGGQGGRGRQTRSGLRGRVSGRAKTKPATGQGGRAFAKRPGVTNRTSAPSTPRRPRLTAAQRRAARRSSR